MEAFEYDPIGTFEKDKAEPWDAGKEEMKLSYGGFDLRPKNVSIGEYEKIEENLEGLKNMFTAARLRNIVPMPILNTPCMVFGWHSDTFEGEEKNWCCEDTATFGIISSMQLPMKDDIQSLSVDLKLLHREEGEAKWYTTTVQVKKLDEPNVFGEQVVVESDDVNTDDLKVFIPSDVYIADLFDLGTERIVSLTI